ncbi:MAG: DUF1028 domain-containing protein [Candidatus Competibacteraceae bacterium]
MRLCYDLFHVAFDPTTGDLGVAVESTFPNVGVNAAFAKAGVGAIATQSYFNTSYGPRGLSLLENGATPQRVVDILIADDPERDYRQVGIVDTRGRAANFTGAHCFDWAGGISGENFSVQGNTLVSQAVAASMAQAFNSTDIPLAERLLASLSAGQSAGGDRRGQQSAALLVVREGGGYGGHNDRYVDISVYDHATPIEELKRLYAIHRLTFFRSDPADLVPVDTALANELQQILQARGFYKGAVTGLFDDATRRSLRDFMGWENYDERIRDDNLIDLEVMADIRIKHQAWLERHAAGAA